MPAGGIFLNGNTLDEKKDLSFSLEELGECVDGKNNTEEKFDESEVVVALNEFLGILNKEKIKKLKK